MIGKITNKCKLVVTYLKMSPYLFLQSLICGILYTGLHPRYGITKGPEERKVI